MVIKQVEGDKSKGLWPVRAIIVARTLIFFHFVIIFVGFFFFVTTVTFWKFLCDWIMKIRNLLCRIHWAHWLFSF
jgi:hypothetical protein